MTSHNSPSNDFSLAFQQLASFVAISKTRSTAESYDEIIKQCYAVLPNEPLGDAASVMVAIQVIYPGIRLEGDDVMSSIARLLKSGDLIHLPGNQLGLSIDVRTKLQDRISAARRLEESVKQSWLATISATHPSLEREKLWTVLKSYLAAAFRRHGIQAVMLLDPTMDIGDDQSNGLTPLLNDIIQKEFQKADCEHVREAVASFFATVNLDRHRAEYVSQLADGAFNYFTLSIAPDVADELRSKLYPITLFLDTNFLFGILKLHVNPQVEVSIRLVEAAKRFNLPFSLRYHEATKNEMNDTLFHFGTELRKQTWPQAVSRAAVASSRFSGIELKYHQLNAEAKVDVSDFLSPYDHWEVLLKDRGIDVYKVDSSQRRLNARATLEADYKDFLARKRKTKPDGAIQHDMAVLETVRSLRTNARSSLEAGALLITCDNQLFRFDLENNRFNRTPGCVVLPSIFWQILRPFVSDSGEFNQAFAETFALPEFSFTQGGAAKAASKLLSILASYQDIPEEIASRMLANDLLLEKLNATTSEQDYHEAVDDALMQEAVELLEEKAALEKQLIVEAEKREEREKELAQAEYRLKEQQMALAEKEKTLEDYQTDLQSLGQQIKEERQSSREIVEQVIQDKEVQKQAEQRLADMERQKTAAERHSLRTIKVTSILIGSLAVLVFELMIHFVIPWHWLLTHTHSYGLQASTSLMIFTLIVGLGVKPWRKVLWLTVFLGVLFVVLQLLGGPALRP